MGFTFSMKVIPILVIIGLITAATVNGEPQRQQRRGRNRAAGRRRQQQRQRAGRQQQQQQQFDLGPPPQPVISIPDLPAAPLPVSSVPANRFIPTGPAPGSALPPESLTQGNIPDREGKYDFTFETEDGEFRREQGRAKSVGGGETANEISGEFSWISPEGELVSFTYKADENGYQAQGSHLPQAPPLHPHIQRGLELIARVNQRRGITN